MRHVLIVALLALAGCTEPGVGSYGGGMPYMGPPIVLSTPQPQPSPMYVPPMRPALTCSNIGGMVFCN